MTGRDGADSKVPKPRSATRRGRDEFSPTTREEIARRAGFRCSNPDCRKLTCGPRSDGRHSVDIGVAAHVAAAAEGGPRYDASMTPEERVSITNAVWLCQSCAKLVDNDEDRYPAGVLQEWTGLAEHAALLELAGATSAHTPAAADTELLRFYAQCLDRPAFQDPFRIEGSMEAFDQAIEDTITAINTGCLRDRRGREVALGRGKAFLTRHAWRREMDMVVDLLRGLRARYQHAVLAKEITIHPEPDGREFYASHNPEVADWMDATRAEVLDVFSGLCVQAGLPKQAFPRLLGAPRGRHMPSWR
jgi:hypothetical protein